MNYRYLKKEKLWLSRQRRTFVRSKRFPYIVQFVYNVLCKYQIVFQAMRQHKNTETIVIRVIFFAYCLHTIKKQS